MPSTDDLIEHLKSLPDRPARYTWLDGLERTERNSVLNRLTDQDRQRYRMHQHNGVRVARKAVADADLAARREVAVAGRATEIEDMVQALYTVMPKLTESQREWVEKIDQTASASTRKRNKFTPKQATIIQDLYRKQFQAEKD